MNLREIVEKRAGYGALRVVVEDRDVVPDAISGAETSERAEGAPDAQGVLYSKSHADAAGVETQDQNAKPETLSTIPQANTEAGDGATELPDVGL